MSAQDLTRCGAVLVLSILASACVPLGNELDESDGGSGGFGGEGGSWGGASERCYTEEVHPEADLSDLEADYDPDTWIDTVDAALARRYPAGAEVVAELMDRDQMAGWLTGGMTDFGVLMSFDLDTLVHESTHLVSNQRSVSMNFENVVFVLGAEHVYEMPYIDGFGMGELVPLVPDDSTDLYKEGYLLDPQIATQGFMSVLDEQTAYVSGAGASVLFGDLLSEYGGHSARDGPLAFTLFVALYLRHAREEYPDLYSELKSTPPVVDLIRTNWLRMHFFLAIREGEPLLSVEAERIAELLYSPSHQGEIERFLGVKLSRSNCLGE